MYSQNIKGTLHVSCGYVSLIAAMASNYQDYEIIKVRMDVI
jgi:hypothetical protein